MRAAMHNMGREGFICLLILLVLSSFSSNVDFVFANSLTPYLQQQSRQVLCHSKEKLALLQFKQSFVIDCSSSQLALAYPKVNSWQNYLPVENGSSLVDCCMWDGVECNEETGHVIGLDLSSSCLYGNFPPNSTVFSLDHLQELNLADNDFNHSPIPSSIDRLYNLTSLNLSMSGFSGQVPVQISKLSSLSLLDLSYNTDASNDGSFYLQLHDLSLDVLVRNLSHVSQLYLDYVDISSVVPPILSNLTCLKSISLSNCGLYGELPQQIFQLPHLEQVCLSFNEKLGGNLPEFQHSSPLRILDLRLTAFTGELPPSVGNLGYLNVLDLWNCYLFGQVPRSLGNLSKLTHLNLEGNNFSGFLPSFVSNLTELISLDLSDLNVSPVILDSWLLKLTKLKRLGLTSMNIGGEVPSNLANLTSLTYLDLSSNHITSSFPYMLANLTQLRSLDLDNNQFQGPIPSWFSKFVNLQSLSLSNTNLVISLEPFFKLQNLHILFLSNVSLQAFPDVNSNSSLRNLAMLDLDSCNLKKFPEFLREQNELKYLSLASNHIEGLIPHWFLDVARESLLFLDLSYNTLESFEQPTSILPWASLEYLDFQGNKLRGQLPTPLNSMQSYRFSGNQLSGVIPKQICRASFLSVLDLSMNNMSGRVPDCISHQLGDSLEALNLRGNSFHGTIPGKFSTSCTLKMINLGQNQFSGQLPRSLANCMMLEVLDVGQNHISDTFPSWLENIANLQVLVLRHNSFHGSIRNPMSNNGFKSLRIIDLSCNLHSGPLPSRYLHIWRAMQIPNEDHLYTSNSEISIDLPVSDTTYSMDEIYNYVITITNKGSDTYYSKILTVYRVIDLSSNNFIGGISSSLGNLRGLQVLNLSNNNLEGNIPSSLSQINDLESLDVSQNMLSGMIPQELSKLTFLEVFNVSHNLLVGAIPRGEQFNTFDSSCFDGNSALCGAPLDKECGNISFWVPEWSQKEEIKEGYELVDWIVKLLGYGCGFIVGYVIGKIYITDRHHAWFIETFGRRGRWDIVE